MTSKSDARALLAAFSPPAILIVALVAAWGWLSERGSIPNYLLPSPARLLSAIASNGSVLLRHGLVTSSEALGGFALGAASGVIVAIVLASSRWLRECFFSPGARQSEPFPCPRSRP